MTEEEYFRKHYPDSCYGDKPLSPYWDFFQDGIEFGERQSAKKIAELERKLEQTEKDLADYQFNYPTIKELEKENAELRNNGFTVSAMTEQQLKAALEKGEQLEKQLEVAKDLIHQFLIQNPISDWLPKKAEQFLKEIGK